MRHINYLTLKDLDPIRLIVFDVDGVLVRRGTKIKSTKDFLELGIKHVDSKQIEQIQTLYKKGFLININSGRGLYMLQLMFRAVLPYVSLTYENGSATWIYGKIVQHVNSYEALDPVIISLLSVKDERIKGWEPKEFITTIHCTERVPKIEKIVSTFSNLYIIWNGEAYDIGMKIDQTKAVGLINLELIMGLEAKNILVIGDNYNDIPMMSVGGVAVTADKDRVKGDFWVPIDDERLPADILMSKIIDLMEN
jgi:hydroxymethylpyrimidine pyrophosphatase-like HAD family hydrolase